MDKLKTLKDIADELGLSITTVSLVLNGLGEKYRVKKMTRDRILAYVKTEKFVLDQRAKSLRTNRTRIVSLLMNHLPAPLSLDIISHFEDIAFQQGYRLVLHFLTDKTKTETVLLRMLDKQVDGCLIGMERQEQEHVTMIQRSLGNELPTVLFELSETGNIKEYFDDVEQYDCERHPTKACLDALFHKLKLKMENISHS